jgi:hypothetical protein
MDKLDKHRSVIKKILYNCYEMANTQVISSKEIEVSDRLALDEERD